MVNSYLSKINFTLSGAGRQPGGAHAGMENEEEGKANVTPLRKA